MFEPPVLVIWFYVNKWIAIYPCVICCTYMTYSYCLNSNVTSWHFEFVGMTLIFIESSKFYMNVWIFWLESCVFKARAAPAVYDKRFRLKLLFCKGHRPDYPCVRRIRWQGVFDIEVIFTMDQISNLMVSFNEHEQQS